MWDVFIMCLRPSRMERYPFLKQGLTMPQCSFHNIASTAKFLQLQLYQFKYKKVATVKKIRTIFHKFLIWHAFSGFLPLRGRVRKHNKQFSLLEKVIKITKDFSKMSAVVATAATYFIFLSFEILSKCAYL